MNKITTFTFTGLLLGAAANLYAETPPPTPVLEIDFKAPTRPVSPILHGLMTEEINHSYDGGLYAELIRNRVFRDDAKNEPVHWSTTKQPGADGTIRVVATNPLTDKLPNSLEVKITAATETQRFCVMNDGFWGIPVKPNTTYRVSFYVKGDTGVAGYPQGDIGAPGQKFDAPLRVSLVSADGTKVHAQAQTPAVTTRWQKIELTLTTGADVVPSTENRFVISSGNTGRFWLSLVSLFPPTYKDRPNGFRPDIMEKTLALKPKFLRFPGGSYLCGQTLWDRFDWKATLGPLPFRAGHPSFWDYRASDGVGLLEFMQWCEDLNAQPVLGVFSCYSGCDQTVDAGPLLAPYVQDALDEVEYLTGDAKTTYWGAKRARDGHPAPFVLNYVEIGNEDHFDKTGSYDARFTQFYDAFKARYPKIQLIATDRAAKTRTPDLYDDHFYRHAQDFFTDLGHYDNADRNGPKVIVGEWATHENGGATANFHETLGDAAWMTSMERNSDIVVMHCYAPLFVNVNPGGMQWQTNLIGYDGLGSYGSPSYYAQVMFASHIGDVTPKSELKAAPGVFLPHSVTRQTATGKVFLKVVNPGVTAQPVKLALKGLTIQPEGVAITLRANGPLETNTIKEPTKIIPVTTPLKNVTSSFDYTFPGYSITVLEIHTR